MTLAQLVASGLVVKILGERMQRDPALYRAADISQPAWWQWKAKAMVDNPRGLYAKLRAQLEEAREIGSAKAIERLNRYADGVEEVYEKYDSNGDLVSRTVATKPDVKAALYYLHALYPEFDPRVRAERMLLEQEKERAQERLALLPLIEIQAEVEVVEETL